MTVSLVEIHVGISEHINMVWKHIVHYITMLLFGFSSVTCSKYYQADGRKHSRVWKRSRFQALDGVVNVLASSDYRIIGI